MSGLVTEARVEIFMPDGATRTWRACCKDSMSVPEAVEHGRHVRCNYLTHADPITSPVRVIDAAGAVVEQWGRP